MAVSNLGPQDVRAALAGYQGRLEENSDDQVRTQHVCVLRMTLYSYESVQCPYESASVIMMKAQLRLRYHTCTEGFSKFTCGEIQNEK